MSRLSRGFKNVAKAVVNPVGAGIERLTGISQKDQLLAGAGIGLGAGMFRRGAPGTVATAQGVAGAAGAAPGGQSLFSPSSLFPSVIGAGADIWSAQQVSEGVKEANQMSLQSAREQMSFQERMSSTAHQREVADLKAAGLNPVLSANAGASTPTGASIVAENEAPDYRGIVPKGFQTAVQMRQAAKDIESADAAIGAAHASAALSRRQTEVAAESAKVNRAEASIREAEAVGKEMEASFYKRNPGYMARKKYLELLAPVFGAARDIAFTYRGIKGLGGKDLPDGVKHRGYDRYGDGR